MSTKNSKQTTLDQFGFIIKTHRNKNAIKGKCDKDNNKAIKLKLSNNSTLTQMFCEKLIIYIYIINKQ